MAYPKISYLEWCRRYMGTVRFDLARSNIKALGRDEFPFDASQVELALHDETGRPELRKAIASRYGVPPERVFVCSGATMGIYLATAAVVSAGDEVLVEHPHYEPLSKVPLHLGASVKRIDRSFDRKWRIDPGELELNLGPRSRALLLTNLHNPSGAAIPSGEMAELGRLAAARNATVICSEVYLENASVGGLAPAVTLGRNLVSIGSFSKVWGLGGLRIGWIVGPEAVMSRVAEIQDYVMGGHSAASQSLALLAFSRADSILARCRRIVQANAAVLADWMKEHPALSWVPPEGGTVALVRLPKGVDAQDLSDRLRAKHSVLVVPGDAFGLPGFLRIALGVDEEILREGLKHLGPALEQRSSPARQPIRGTP